MSSTRLYREGFDQFCNSVVVKTDRDDALLKDFLEERESPQSVKEVALTLKEVSERKYGHDFGPIPKGWISRIIENIHRVIVVGDFAVKGGPESVGMAWMVVKLTLGAIQEDYALYDLFGVGLTTVTEVMTIIPHYDKLYDDRGEPGQDVTAYMDSLFSGMRNAYSATLNFCFSVKRHVKGRKRDKAVHTLKNFFGVERSAFQAKLDEMVALKEEIIEKSAGAFHETVFDRFTDLRSTIENLSEDVKRVAGFQETQEEILKSIRHVETQNAEYKKNTRPKTLWELAEDRYNKLMTALNPVQNPTAEFDEVKRKKVRGESIFEHTRVVEWRNMNSPPWLNLVLVGKEGSGKTSYVSAIFDSLHAEVGDGKVIMSVSCRSNDIGAQSTPTVSKILGTLLGQLMVWVFNVAKSEGRNADLLTKCIGALRESGPKSSLYIKTDMITSFSAISRVYRALGDRIEQIFLVIDGIDAMTGPEQKDTCQQIGELCSQGEAIKTLVTCRPKSQYYESVDSDPRTHSVLHLAVHNERDMTVVLDAALRDIPGLTPEILNETKQLILKRANSRFRYLEEIAIPYMRKPFQGSILDHVRNLPETAYASYEQFVQSLDPGSLALLRASLSLTLYCAMDVKVQEIMDVFTGIYLTPGDGLTNDKPEPTELQMEQLRNATRPFLVISRTSVWMDDSEEIREFLTPNENIASDNDTLCAKCAGVLHAKSSLAVHERDWHLDLAIRCLQHLNSSLFQRRYGLSVNSATDNDESALTRQVIDAWTTDMATRMEIPQDLEGGDAKPSGDLANGSDDEKDSIAGDSNDDFSAGEAAEWPSAHTSWSNNDWAASRYEIDYWYEHALVAQRLWPDKEEIRAHPKWQSLMHELDQFTVKNEPAFNLWQKSFFRRNPCAGNKDGTQPWKPLHIAAYTGLTSWAEHIMDECGADPTSVSCNRTVLQAAAEGRGAIDTLRLLLERGANPNMSTSHRPAFHSSLYKDPSLEMIDVFMRYGANPNKAYSDFDMYPLHYFASRGDDPAALTRLIITESSLPRVDINAVNKNGRTPLHVLLDRSPVPIDLLKAFIAHGADINAEDSTSTRPLQLACLSGEAEVVQVLLEGTTDVNDPDTAGRNAMHTAAQGGFIDCIDALIQAKADIQATDHHGRTPLFYACLNDTGDTAQHIIGILRKREVSGDEMNKSTRFAQTPLMQAARKGLTEVVKMLLESLGANKEALGPAINKADKQHGRTALHQATRRASTEIVKMLLEGGADASVRDRGGKTPLDICQERWASTPNLALEEMALQLIDKNPDMATQNRDVAATAAINGSTKVLKKLRACSVDLSACDRFGWTPLALAKHFRQEEAEEYLRQQAAWIHALPARWVGTRNDETISEDGLTITYSGGRIYCISTDTPLPQGLERYYYEVTSRRREGVVQEEYPILAIGFCTQGANSLHFPGWPPKPSAPSAKSWAYHGDDGYICTSADGASTFDSSRRYGPGDTVGVGYDSRTGTIWFTRNGRLMQPVHSNVHGRMFPVIGLEHSVELHTNFGPEGFMWTGGSPIAKTALPAIADEREEEAEPRDDAEELM